MALRVRSAEHRSSGLFLPSFRFELLDQDPGLVLPGTTLCTGRATTPRQTNTRPFREGVHVNHLIGAHHMHATAAVTDAAGRGEFVEVFGVDGHGREGGWNLLIESPGERLGPAPERLQRTTLISTLPR